jgi:tetratricopeptide (TPR) repeat protein
MGDITGEAQALALLGDAYYGLGRYDDAVAAYVQALPVFRDHFMFRYRALCLYKLGRTYQTLGDQAQAKNCLKECLPLFRELRLPEKEKLALAALRETPSAV